MHIFSLRISRLGLSCTDGPCRGLFDSNRWGCECLPLSILWQLISEEATPSQRAGHSPLQATQQLLWGQEKPRGEGADYRQGKYSWGPLYTHNLGDFYNKPSLTVPKMESSELRKQKFVIVGHQGSGKVSCSTLLQKQIVHLFLKKNMAQTDLGACKTALWFLSRGLYVNHRYRFYITHHQDGEGRGKDSTLGYGGPGTFPRARRHLATSLFIIFILLLSWLFSSVFFLFSYFHLHFFLFLKWCRFQPMCVGPRWDNLVCWISITRCWLVYCVGGLDCLRRNGPRGVEKGDHV